MGRTILYLCLGVFLFCVFYVVFSVFIMFFTVFLLGWEGGAARFFEFLTASGLAAMCAFRVVYPNLKPASTPVDDEDDDFDEIKGTPMV